jgi:hypothetical protein
MDDAERTIRRLRADARSQQEDAEVVVAELAKASRTLRDAVLDHARSGHGIRIELGETWLSGTVVHVGDDLVRIVVADHTSIDVVLPAVSALRISGGGNGPATVSTGYPDTLLARCRELVQTNARVEIGRCSAPPITGELQAATGTHLEVDVGSNNRWLVPLDAVCSIRRVER